MCKLFQSWILFILIAVLPFCASENVDNHDATGEEAIATNGKCDENNENCKHKDDERGYNDQSISDFICIACNSTIDPTCATNTTFEIFEACKLSIDSTKCYHMIDATTEEHTRGCLEYLPDTMIEICEKNGDECKVCSGSNCNSRTTFIKCLNCHTSDDRQCAINPQLFESKICEKYDDQCFTSIGRFNVSRGCMSEKGDVMHCRSDSNKCEMCDTLDKVGCNNRIITMETCVECDSLKDPKCHENPYDFTDKVCSNLNTKDLLGCYLSVRGNRYKRGCIRDLVPSAQDACKKQSGNCKSCEGKNCNTKKEFQQCIHCNSRENIDCPQNGMVQTSRICENYLSSCITGIDAHGHTHRRCSRAFIDDEIEFPNNQLAVCTTNKCNTGIFPSNRLQCYRCESDEDFCDFMPSNSTELPTTSIQLVPCGILSKFDQCYAYLSEDKKIYRGCLTDPTDHRLLCEKDDPNKKGLCIKCGETGCNNTPIIRPPSLSCIHCDKSAECAFGQDKNKATQCETDVPFGAEESCYSHYHLDGSWAERGCTLDSKKTPNSTENTENIKYCSKSGCNNENIIQSECVCCKSGFKGKCATISDSDIESFMKQCKGTYSYEKRGCYTMLKNETVHRGCIKDLNESDYEACQKKENCELCTENHCNIDAAGSSDRITANIVVITFIICIKFLFDFKSNIIF